MNWGFFSYLDQLYGQSLFICKARPFTVKERLLWPFKKLDSSSLFQGGHGLSSEGGRTGSVSPPQLVDPNSGVFTQTFLPRSFRCERTSLRHGWGAGVSHLTALPSVTSSPDVGGQLESHLSELIWTSPELQKKSVKSSDRWATVTSKLGN